MKAALTSAVLLMLGSSLAHGEPQADHTPKPSREARMLGYNVGTWEGHGETEGGPFGLAAHSSPALRTDQAMNLLNGSKGSALFASLRPTEGSHSIL